MNFVLIFEEMFKVVKKWRRIYFFAFLVCAFHSDLIEHTTLIAYISKVNLNIAKCLKVSVNSNKTTD